MPIGTGPGCTLTTPRERIKKMLRYIASWIYSSSQLACPRLLGSHEKTRLWRALVSATFHPLPSSLRRLVLPPGQALPDLASSCIRRARDVLRFIIKRAEILRDPPYSLHPCSTKVRLMIVSAS